MKLKKEEKIMYSVILVLTVLFVTSHLTPEISIRTNVLFAGHVKEALFSTIEEADKNEVLNQEQAMYYRISPAPVEKSTNTPLNLYKVDEKLNMYFSSFHSNS